MEKFNIYFSLFNTIQLDHYFTINLKNKTWSLRLLGNKYRNIINFHVNRWILFLFFKKEQK